jgi:hypothetical protein
MPNDALEEYKARTGKEFKMRDDDISFRTDKIMIDILKNRVEEIESYIEVLEIPDDVDWIVCEYDGVEWIAEKHRTWHSKRRPSWCK